MHPYHRSLSEAYLPTSPRKRDKHTYPLSRLQMHANALLTPPREGSGYFEVTTAVCSYNRSIQCLGTRPAQIMRHFCLKAPSSFCIPPSTTIRTVLARGETLSYVTPRRLYPGSPGLQYFCVKALAVIAFTTLKRAFCSTLAWQLGSVNVNSITSTSQELTNLASADRKSVV